MIGDARQIGPPDFDSPSIGDHDDDAAIRAIRRCRRLQINLNECGTGGPETAPVVIQSRDRKAMCRCVFPTRLIYILISGDKRTDLCLTSSAASFGSLHSSSEPDFARSLNQGDGRTLTIYF